MSTSLPASGSSEALSLARTYKKSDAQAQSHPSYHFPQHSYKTSRRPRMNFNAYDLLGLHNPDKAGLSCVGHARSQGRRCMNPIARDNFQTAKRYLAHVPALVGDRNQLHRQLLTIAGLTLCRQYHRGQAESIAARWHATIERHIEQQGNQIDDNSSTISRASSQAAIRNLASEHLSNTSTISSQRAVFPQPQRVHMNEYLADFERLRNSITPMPYPAHPLVTTGPVNVQVNIGQERASNNTIGIDANSALQTPPSTAPREKQSRGRPPPSPSPSPSPHASSAGRSSARPRTPESAQSSSAARSIASNSARGASLSPSYLDDTPSRGSSSLTAASRASTVTLGRSDRDSGSDTLEEDHWTEVGSLLSDTDSDSEDDVPLTPASTRRSISPAPTAATPQRTVQPQPLQSWQASWQEYEAQWRSLSSATTPLTQDNIPWPVRSGRVEEVTTLQVQDFFSQGPPNNVIENDDDFCRLLRRQRLRWQGSRIIERFCAGQQRANDNTLRAANTVQLAINELVGLS
ncbi:hypothetical protein K431DRAFT_281230 [Polychaeton citri CBS 116435]|uniref:Uncharacterized protein n=1 Tax=Polychaeton citri CBS 116435 TaxID=1314669 RepID=A0A9P4UR63_9PEZI|nr:hypothetical protein K431DRAFT_281230 [Polychaeton citri CBS 116435]